MKYAFMLVAGLCLSGLNAWAGAIDPVNIQDCLEESKTSPDVYQIYIPSSSQNNPIHAPLCSEAGTYLRIDGAADFNKTTDLLKPYGYYPLQVNEFGGKAYWQVWIVKHPKVNVGPKGQIASYNEAIFSVAVTRDKNKAPMSMAELMGKLSQSPVPSDIGIYVQKIWVSSEVAVSAGNEIWGFNKTKGNIALSAVKGSSVTGSISEGKTAILDLNVAMPAQAIPTSWNWYTFTRFTKATSVVTNAGTSLMDNFGSGDHITFQNAGYGAVMNSLNFTPISKLLVPVGDLKYGVPQSL